MEQIEVKTITPKELGAKLGIDAKRVRSMLRNQFPREAKNKNWTIPLDMAKKVEKAYKAKHAKKKIETKKELKSG
jgi:hypothetical protein